MVWPSIKGSLREPDGKGTSARSRAKEVPPTSGMQQVANQTPPLAWYQAVRHGALRSPER